MQDIPSYDFESKAAEFSQRYPSILLDTSSACGVELLHDILFLYKSHNVPILHFMPSDVVRSLCPCNASVHHQHQLEAIVERQAMNYRSRSEILLTMPLKEIRNGNKTHRELLLNNRHRRISFLLYSEGRIALDDLRAPFYNLDFVIQSDTADAMRVSMRERQLRLQPTRKWVNQSISFLQEMLCPVCKQKQAQLVPLFLSTVPLVKPLVNIVMSYSLEGCNNSMFSEQKNCPAD